MGRRENVNTIGQVLRACAPVAAPPDQCASGSMLIPVPGVKPWLPLLREYAQTGKVVAGPFAIEKLDISADSFGVTLKWRNNGGPGSQVIPHEVLTRGLYRREWVSLEDNVQMRLLGDITFPAIAWVAGAVEIMLPKPVEYRVDLTEFASQVWRPFRWAMPKTITIRLAGITVHESHADPLFEGWKGKLVRWLKKPRLVFDMVSAMSPEYLTQSAALDARKKKRSPLKSEDEWRCEAREAHRRYKVDCYRRNAAMTPAGARRYIERELTGSGLAAGIVWWVLSTLIRRIVWEIINESYAGAESDGE